MGNSGTRKEGIFLPDNVFDSRAIKYAVYNTCWTVNQKSIFPVRVPKEHHETKKERWISPPLPGRFMVPKGGLARG
jgi:hypothetical protein